MNTEENDSELSTKEREYYAEENRQHERSINSFYAKYARQEPITELEIQYESHTHFSMIKKGVFPPGTETRESILPKVIGSWGGRFKSFTDRSFEYIAYTD